MSTSPQPSLILLSSAKADQSGTRSFNIFNTKDDLARKVIGYYEEYLLVHSNEDEQTVNYKSEDLFNWMEDFFAELVCLEAQSDDNKLDIWIPWSTSWIKEVIYLHFKARLGSDIEISPPDPNLPNKPIRPITTNGTSDMDIDYGDEDNEQDDECF